MKIKIKDFIRALQLLEDQITPDGLLETPSNYFMHDRNDWSIYSVDPKIDLRISYTPEKYFVPKGFEDKKYKDSKWEKLHEKYEVFLTKTETKEVTLATPMRFEGLK